MTLLRATLYTASILLFLLFSFSSFSNVRTLHFNVISIFIFSFISLFLVYSFTLTTFGISFRHPSVKPFFLFVVVLALYSPLLNVFFIIFWFSNNNENEKEREREFISPVFIRFVKRAQHIAFDISAGF